MNAKTDIRGAQNISKAVSKYRIRFSLIGFNFRKEYYEYLEVKDLELRKHGQLEAQEIRFETQPEADQLLMLSVSLLAYSETRMEGGYVPLNSKEFSPCSIIAAYAAEEPGDYPLGPLNIELSEAQQTRGAAICMMCHVGNRLLSNLKRKVVSKTTATKKRNKAGTRCRPCLRRETGVIFFQNLTFYANNTILTISIESHRIVARNDFPDGFSLHFLTVPESRFLLHPEFLCEKQTS